MTILNFTEGMMGRFSYRGSLKPVRRGKGAVSATALSSGSVV